MRCPTFLAWASPASGEVRLDDGLAPRAELWRAAIAMWKTDPGLGVGAGNYELLTPTVGLIGVRTHANNVYLQSLAEGGVLLCAAVIWTIVAAVVLLARSPRRVLGIGIVAATVALAVHQCLDDLTFFPKIGGLWWTLLGVGAATLAVRAYGNATRMTLVRTALGLIVTIFITAEIARPTHVPAKKFSAHALVLHSQAAVEGAGVYGSLDPNLLADLPRIHPDAAGDVILFSSSATGRLAYSVRFYGDDGSAVFVISDDVRLGTEATIFGDPTQPHSFSIEIPPN